jgi:hypothetical protein
VKLKLSEQAREAIERIETYWSENRPKNPYLFREELNYAFFQIETSPRSAPIHEEEGYAYHKLILPGTRHWVLYEYHEEADMAVVMTVWSPRRGDRPRLPK